MRSSAKVNGQNTWKATKNGSSADSVSVSGLSESQQKRAQEDDSVPGKQTNNITVKNPTGPTTLVINSFPSISSTSRVQLACPKVPDDIASMPAFPPVQPVNIKYPATLISGKARSFNPAWYKVYPWLEYSIQRVHVTVTAVICLALDLVPNVKNPSHWWDLRIGSMPLEKVVCFPSMIAAVLTEIRLFRGNSTKSIHIEKHPSPIGSEFLELNKLHKIGITS